MKIQFKWYVVEGKESSQSELQGNVADKRKEPKLTQLRKSMIKQIEYIAQILSNTTSENFKSW